MPRTVFTRTIRSTHVTGNIITLSENNEPVCTPFVEDFPDVYLKNEDMAKKAIRNLKKYPVDALISITDISHVDRRCEIGVKDFIVFSDMFKNNSDIYRMAMILADCANSGMHADDALQYLNDHM